MKKNIIIALLVMGLSGLIAQIVLLRELLVTFYGNELSIGIILANWLILEALGSYVFRRKADIVKRKIETFVFIQMLFALFLPCMIYFSRILKTMVSIVPGEGIGIISLGISSFLILLPVSFTHGALFTFGCRLYSSFQPIEKRSENESGQSIGKVYILETIGTLIGGLGFTYLLLPLFNSFQIGFGISFLNIFICIFLLKFTYPNNSRKSFLSTKVLIVSLILILFLFTYFIFSSNVNTLHDMSIKKQWKGQNIIYYHNSKYENVAVTKMEEQYTFYSNGVPVITVPTPDITFIEEFVHIPLLAHSNPEDILIISGGAGGVIREILKYDVEKIDYVELDPALLKAVKKFSVPLTETELTNEKVDVIYKDGRMFVKNTDRKYDVVLVGFSLPIDLQINRLFTKEFFSLTKRVLKDEGILVLSLPGSLSYINEELKELNVCIMETLNQVFPFIKIIPGDTNLYLASSSDKIKKINPELLTRRLKHRNITTNLLVPAYLQYKYKLDLHREDWFKNEIGGIKIGINQDLKPIGVYYSLSYWNALFSPYVNKILDWFKERKLKLVLFLLGIFIFIFIFIVLSEGIFSYTKNISIEKDSSISYILSKSSIPYAITTTGFAGMIFDLALIFTFQSLYGYVYYWVGILVTMFMVGAALGSSLVTFKLTKIKKNFSLFLKIELLLIIFTAILPFIFIQLEPYLGKLHISLIKGVFLILCLLAGILVGLEFPIANKLYLIYSHYGKGKGKIGSTAGLLYSSDLIGGWIAGIVGSVMLLPILGLGGTSLLVILLKITSIIVLIMFHPYRKRDGI